MGKKTFKPAHSRKKHRLPRAARQVRVDATHNESTRALIAKQRVPAVVNKDEERGIANGKDWEGKKSQTPTSRHIP